MLKTFVVGRFIDAALIALASGLSLILHKSKLDGVASYLHNAHVRRPDQASRASAGTSVWGPDISGTTHLQAGCTSMSGSQEHPRLFYTTAQYIKKLPPGTFSFMVMFACCKSTAW